MSFSVTLYFEHLLRHPFIWHYIFSTVDLLYSNRITPQQHFVIQTADQQLNTAHCMCRNTDVQHTPTVC